MVVLGPPRVAVVGAGVAGLVATRTLQRQGIATECFEARAAVGGRLATDELEGFQLDHGYQILIDAYPEVQRQLDLPALELRSFAPGALLSNGGSMAVVADPLRRPAALLPTLRAGVASLGDVLRLLLNVVLRWVRSEPYETLQSRTAALETTAAFLRRIKLCAARRQSNSCMEGEEGARGRGGQSADKRENRSQQLGSGQH